MTNKPMTNAALLRKVARLEAELQAARDFMLRDRAGEFAMICRNADIQLRMQQAIEILSGGDA